MIPRTSLLAVIAATIVGLVASITIADTGRASPAGEVTQRAGASPAAAGDAPSPRLPSVATVQPPQATEGSRLFVSYTCGACPGAGGSGAMAPSLADNRWRYGGTQDAVFRSIAEGRPGGMPAWGAMIPGPQMIALTAYVRSLGEGKDLSTENFTGATVERSGR
jgi:cytochrome c oxidase cbb3-type subunit 3